MTEPEKKTADKKEKKKTPAKAETKPATVKKTSAVHALLFIIIFFVILGTLGGFYLLWENQQKNSIREQLAQQQLNQQINALKQQQQSSSEQYQQQIEALKTAQKNLRTNLTKLVRNNTHLRNDWLLAEAEYLVQLANYRLLLEKDIVTAQVALKAADTRLAEVADPALLPVRKILARDIQSLGNITPVDLAGLSVTLSALSENIRKLPLRTPDPQTRKLQQAEQQSSKRKLDSLTELPAAIWQDIKNLIVIRHHDKPLQPLLAPDQHFFLVQNLALQVEQARLALLNGQNTVYQERLETIKKWINDYFDTSHNITRNMLSNIEALQKVDIDPPLPDISSTYAAIKQYRLRGRQVSSKNSKAE